MFDWLLCSSPLLTGYCKGSPYHPISTIQHIRKNVVGVHVTSYTTFLTVRTWQHDCFKFQQISQNCLKLTNNCRYPLPVFVIINKHCQFRSLFTSLCKECPSASPCLNKWTVFTNICESTRQLLLLRYVPWSLLEVARWWEGGGFNVRKSELIQSGNIWTGAQVHSAKCMLDRLHTGLGGDILEVIQHGNKKPCSPPCPRQPVGIHLH